jgi:RNA polymerase sigma factor (sigma-70 family)
MPSLMSPPCRRQSATLDCDEELLAHYRACRNQEAFAALVERHGLMVIRVCRGILGNAADAEDVAQAVFLELARRPEMVRRSVAGWLHELARSRAINELRGRRRRLHREGRAGMQAAASLDENADEWREELGRALNQLRTRLRQAVVLRYVEGRSVVEAAQAAGCPPGTMGRRSQEGLRQLRGILTRRVAATLTALVAAVTGHAKLSVAAALIATGVGITLPTLVQQAAQSPATDAAGRPVHGTITVNGVNMAFRAIAAEAGHRVYYQVDVPTRTGGTYPFTVGVPATTPPDQVPAFIQERVKLIVGNLTIPLRQ